MRLWIWTPVIACALSACVVEGGDIDNPLDDSGVMMQGGNDQADAGPMMSGERCVAADECPSARSVCRIPDGSDEGRCVQCADNDGCIENEICGERFTCDATEGICRESFYCPAERAQCTLFSNGDLGVCVECSGDTDCGGARPVCATTGDCVGAGMSSTCSDNDQCGPLRACVEGACVEA